MKIGFIDYYLDEWHANNYPAWIKEATDGEMVVECAYAVIDSPKPGGRTTDVWCAEMGIRRAMTIEEVIETCDGIVVLSPDNCEKHEELCQLPLRSGKPVYIDKTFAPDYHTAKRIFDLADEYGTPCYSTSALRYAEEYQRIEGVNAISSWGPNGFEIYAIHQLEPIMMMIQSKPVQVMALTGEKWYTMAIRFEDGRTATMASYADGSPFMMNIASASGAKVVEVKSDFFHNFILALIGFFRDPAKIVPHSDTLRIMAARGAGLKALETPGVWVDVM